MKAIRATYYLFAIVIAGLSMMAWLKMDKVSFYHHYFKGIEEVASRNSQDHQEIMVWEAVPTAAAQALPLVFLTGLLPFLGLSTEEHPAAQLTIILPPQPLLSLAENLITVAPTRAP
ncbi:MAG: hypothetical protein AAFR61_14700 [Bacteroidota bacterium]